MRLSIIKQRISKINRTIDNIEFGGCGLFAFYLHKHLKNKHKIDCEIVYIKGEPASIDYNIRFSHILVKIGKYLIDNNGIYQYEESKYYNLEIEKLKDMLSIGELWNQKFHDDINKATRMKKLIYKI